MSQLLTYKDYINYLTAEARKARLDDLAAGILRADGMVAELQAELKIKDEILECASYLLNRGQTIQPDSALHGDIEQALKGN